MSPDPHRSLRIALRANAAFSTICAAATFVAPAAIAEWIGVPDPRWLVGLGVGLLAFAAHLLFTAARSDIAKLRRESLQHSLADFAWVAGSLGVWLAGLLTAEGNWLLLGIGTAVLILGVAQFRSLPRPTTAPLPGRA